MESRAISKADYEAIARFRYALRRFLRFSEEQARRVGLTAQQYQALIAIRGFPDREYVTIGELAERLQIKHHSAVEMVNRLEASDLVRRQNVDHDRRLVRVSLTMDGTSVLDRLVSEHAPKIVELAQDLQHELDNLVNRA